MNSELQLPPFVYRILPWIAAFAFFMQSLDTSILNTALPTMANDLNESPLNMQSAVISYALTLALFIPVSGFLSDKFGTRNIFVMAVSLFTLGSLLCALSNSLIFLDISRVIQGVGGSMMVPISRLVLIKSFKRSDFLAALNTATIPGLIGPVLGPVLGGYLVDMVSWHWVFFINLPIGILGIIISWKYMPNLKGQHMPFDLLGFIFIVISFISATLSVEILNQNQTYYCPLLLATISLLFLFIYREYAKKKQTPLFPLSLFKIRTFKIGIIGNLICRLGISGVPFLIPLLLQVGFGYSAIFAGIMLMPMAIASICTRIFIPRILARLGYRFVLVTNTILAGIMIILMSVLNLSTPLILISLLLFCIGGINSMQYTAMNSITLANLENDNTSSGNSLMAVNQQLAISFGTGLGAVLLRLISTTTSTIHSFQLTFVILGMITVLSSIIFAQLKKEDGQNLTNHQQEIRR
ncbi:MULTISPECIES: DHA2 family efflux MFS transporter permease subunit [unclassified Gilliamella]|uniref:DHA2 family efflux MFS transporter permease subunit n=1 Tax=unclassified Gilliamella TaxID=2685620 RepID=UPI00068EC61C|nr:DHA2 family efflux MFS transporter permease subunit [Gilliamella apicola]MCO6554878.1 DHA2 family efflux MFS transporter permease subunit [Gilliamella sp.]OCG34053.1 MFS transporter [Gilliamella apicola]OCG56243.1 MFS transporter [Gilliamella apicola]OCG66115.1 MFS transporter [Gilliamella apicola]